ncbi:ataxin-10 [Galendromus occidentalis]|uniref:Ataxin-10 n=1 Tax=Galendromus occidentalis TaxID=34638 RepID=A0AAJ6QRJ0_9ACAR|nr:ataxin-10 [Galendromus occidentalis]
MSSSQTLSSILEDNHASHEELSRELRRLSSSISGRITQRDVSIIEVSMNDIAQIVDIIVEERDSDLLYELLALVRNIVPFMQDLRNDLNHSPLNETLAQTVFAKPLIGSLDELPVACYLRLLQYFANSMASDRNTSRSLYPILLPSEGEPLLQVLRCPHEKLVSLAVIVLCHLLENDMNCSDFVKRDDFVEFTRILVRRTLDNSDRDALSLLKKFVMSPMFFSAHFDGLDVSTQCFLMDLISEELTEIDPESEVPTLPRESLEFCIERVKNHIGSMRKTSDHRDPPAMEILFVKLITILSLSSLRDPQGVVTKDLELLIMTIECLRSVHALREDSTTDLDRRSDFGSLAGNKEDIFDHPYFGLKRDLVRLIGNMCYKDKRNQDTVRDFNGIELLCDMSCLDARNPFITQWIVLALRNLVEGNEENKHIIASLTKKPEV